MNVKKYKIIGISRELGCNEIDHSLGKLNHKDIRKWYKFYPVLGNTGIPLHHGYLGKPGEGKLWKVRCYSDLVSRGNGLISTTG